MHLSFCLKALFILFLPFLAFSDPWISGKEEFKVKKLEYLSIKNQFSIDTSAYPISLALIRNPNPDLREGSNSGLVIVLEFASLDHAKRFYESEQYASAKKVREKACSTELVLVEGI